MVLDTSVGLVAFRLLHYMRRVVDVFVTAYRYYKTCRTEPRISGPPSAL